MQTQQTAASPELSTQAGADKDAPYLGQLRSLAFRPLFIVGIARSGTTLLYSILSGSGAFNYLSAYHVLHYRELLYNRIHGLEAAVKADLARQIQERGLTSRGTDRVLVSPDTPEEYGWVLQKELKLSKLLMLLKPYNGAFVKRLLRNLQVNWDTAPILTTLCRKVQFLGDGTKPILLKNPADFNNAGAIRPFYPQARLIVLHRHPLAVLNSWLRLSRETTFTQNAYYALLSQEYWKLHNSAGGRLLLAQEQRAFAPGARQGVERLASLVTQSLTRSVDQLQALPQADLCAVRYEDLCADPAAQIGRIFSHFGLRVPTNLALDRLIAPRRDGLLPEVAELAPRFLAKLGRYLAYCGYDANL